MELTNLVVLLPLAAIVLAPLAREYADLRRSHGLNRPAALGVTALVLPAFGVGTVLALPLAAHPVAQWLTIVVTAVLVYSLATRVIVASASRAGTAPSRSI